MSIFFTGIVVNTQEISGFNTYSGGVPFTWFEFYYSPDSILTVTYVINNIAGYNFKVDILVLAINIVIITLVYLKLIAIFNFVKKTVIMKKKK